MILYLVRHAIAEDTAASGRDADRALTADGKGRMRRAVKGLRALDVQLDLLLTSPYRRAVETAEILAGVLGPVETRVLPELAAGADIPGVLMPTGAKSIATAKCAPPWSGAESATRISTTKASSWTPQSKTSPPEG